MNDLLFYEIASNIISIASYFSICFSLIYIISKQSVLRNSKVYLICLLTILFLVYFVQNIFHVLNIWTDFFEILIYIKFILSIVAFLFAISLYYNISEFLKLPSFTQYLLEYKLKKDIEKVILKTIVYKLSKEQEDFQLVELEKQINEIIQKHK